MSGQSSQKGGVLDTSELPQSTPLLIGKLLSQRKFFMNKSSHVERLDSSSISSNSTIFLSHCDDVEYVVDSACTKIMIEECKNLSLTANEKIITSTIEIWKSQNVTLKLNTQVQTVQVDQCQNVNLQYEDPQNFHSVVWNNSDQLCLKILEAGEEKHVLSTGDSFEQPTTTEESVTQEAPGDKEQIKLKPYQYIVRLIDDKLVTEKLIRAEKGFPITQRELDEWRVKNNITS
ncbi:8158_t:CDS:2 [Dentiscutata erythropus]|uniref:8158_t:CDS:1 n=1 Tax=Dentiscutata erythropus TaxID=1348616 RepID=A0A9N9JAB8_9GLOM|nr:8158_t:CDS:2 [Dentiscutata erythropus]